MSEPRIPTARKDTPLATSGKRRGFIEGDMNRRYLVLPVAQILQSNSPAVTREKDGAKPGVLFDPISEAPLSAAFVPILFYPEIIQWRGREDGGGIVWRSRDLHDERVQSALQWREDDRGRRRPPIATEYLNCVCLFKDRPDPIIITFGKTGLKDGKRFYSLASYRGGDLWATTYEWETFARSNEFGDWWAINVRPVGDTSEETREKAERFWNSLTGMEIEAELDHPDEPVAGPRSQDRYGGARSRDDYDEGYPPHLSNRPPATPF